MASAAAHFDGRTWHYGATIEEVLAKAAAAQPPPVRQGASVSPIPLCVHYADADRVLSPDAPDPVHDWRTCEKGRGVVTPCQHCGPARCPDYEPDVAP